MAATTNTAAVAPAATPRTPGTGYTPVPAPGPRPRPAVSPGPEPATRAGLGGAVPGWWAALSPGPGSSVRAGEVVGS
jgi:hypothetical protein